MSAAPFPRHGGPGLEQVVRPYFNAPARPAAERTLAEPLTTEEVADDVPHISWSASTSGNLITLSSVGMSVKFPDEDQSNNDDLEVVRNTHTVRVENPSDPEQYVDVEVIDSITFKNKYGVQRTVTLTGNSS